MNGKVCPAMGVTSGGVPGSGVTPTFPLCVTIQYVQ
jgi:hypothetical protein